MSFRYRDTVLDELARHGVAPLEGTPPELLHDYINDLYLYEIRRLKQRLLAGEVQRANYSQLVEQLRNRYPILSVPVRFWVEGDES